MKGVVKTEDKPEAGVMVLLVPVSGENMDRDARMDQSDSDGTFTLRSMVPGNYLLMAIEDGWELEWRQEGVLAGYREKGVRVELRAGEETKVVVEAMKMQNEIKSPKRGVVRKIVASEGTAVNAGDVLAVVE